jgi:hypothetical protein
MPDSPGAAGEAAWDGSAPPRGSINAIRRGKRPRLVTCRVRTPSNLLENMGTLNLRGQLNPPREDRIRSSMRPHTRHSEESYRLPESITPGGGCPRPCSRRSTASRVPISRRGPGSPPARTLVGAPQQPMRRPTPSPATPCHDCAKGFPKLLRRPGACYGPTRSAPSGAVSRSLSERK